ncbi:MAG: S8 family serine peptidase [Patulibacter minatonensis]
MHRRRQRPLGAAPTERPRPGSRPRRRAVGTALVGTAAWLAAAGPGLAATAGPAPAVRNHELLVRFKATGQLQRIKVGAGQDPVVLARSLRRHTELFSSVGANLIATAAGTRITDAEESVATAPAGAAQDGTTAPTTPDITVPPSAAVPPPANLKGWVPNDGVGGLGWTSLQWNFVGRFGVDAPQAWEVLRRRGRSLAGGRGVKVAVIDSGIAYRDRGNYRRSPDVDPSRVLGGYDFVDLDRYPDDQSGHGTHVASTIAAATDNGTGLTGLAYNAQILPVRVLDDADSGDVLAIARGIKYAIRRKVDLINLSVDFPVTTTAADIPEVIDAVDAARRAGILVIASSGNDGTGAIAYPARAASVLAVGATTVRGCRSTFSNAGRELALVAPGGGADHGGETKPGCAPGDPGPPIAQVTLMKPTETTNLGVPLDYVGTSMAAAHVTGIAALVVGSRILGRHPSPDLLAAYLVRATRDLGPKGRDSHYGAGLIDAETAVSKAGSSARVRGAERAVATAARKKLRSLPIR